VSDKPELGQMVFGNPTGEVGTEEFADALITELLHEIGRVFWNREQREWDGYEDPKIKGMIFNSYYWGDDEEIAKRPNLKFETSDQEIRWYKHSGRGQSCTCEWSTDQWNGWFVSALKIIRAGDTTKCA